MSTGKPPQKGPNILGVLTDFIVLVLLLGAAAGGGYYWGTIQRMAPVRAVAAGTPGALSADTSEVASVKGPSGKEKANNAAGSDSTKDKGKNKESDNESRTSESKTSDPEENAKAAAGKEGKLKYWIVSSGSDYIGYSITVSVNGTAVDSFFGPGKCIDLTRYVRAGENTVSFDCKLLGDKYNKHKGDERSALTLALVSGAHIIPDNFKKSDVVLTYKRNASESEEFNDTEHFSRD